MVAKVCHALAYVKSGERISEARGLPCPSRADVSEVRPRLCRAKAVRTYRKVRLRLCRVKAVRTYRKVRLRLCHAKAVHYRANRPGGRG